MKVRMSALGTLETLPSSLASVAPTIAGTPAKKDYSANFARTDLGLATYVARRAAGPIKIDGLLYESTWQKAEKSPRFVEDLAAARAPYDHVPLRASSFS